MFLSLSLSLLFTILYQQISKLKQIYATRDGEAVQSALSNLTACARGEGGNLLELSIQVNPMYY